MFLGQGKMVLPDVFGEIITKEYEKMGLER